MRTIVGFHPSGRLHLGHYASVIKPAIEYGADILLARFHAPEATWQDLEDAREILGAFGLEKQIVTQHTSDPNSCLFLDDKDYERKIMKAVTDEAGRANLENIYVLLGGKDTQMDNKHSKQEIIQRYKRQVLVLQQTDRNTRRKIKTPQDYN